MAGQFDYLFRIFPFAFRFGSAERMQVDNEGSSDEEEEEDDGEPGTRAFRLLSVRTYRHILSCLPASVSKRVAN